MTHQTHQGPTPGPWRIVANTPSLIEAMVGDDYRNVGQALEIPREGMTQRTIINEMWANARFLAASWRVTKALEPLAAIAIQLDGEPEWTGNGRRSDGLMIFGSLTLGHCREARAALAEAFGTTGEGE